MKNKKIALTIVTSVAALAVLLLLVMGIAKLFEKEVDTTDLIGNGGVSLAPVDYQEDIFQDESYMAKERRIFFSYDGNGEYIDAASAGDYTPAGTLFYNYFECIINGEYQEYKSFFSVEFLKTAKLPEKFTMQKIYDISITLENSYMYENGIVERYSVRYRIMDNNGSFRSDLENGIVIPVYYTVYVQGTEARITGMSVPK